MTINPIIVIGMHRSGTSLIAKMMKRIGIFMGAEVNNHEESTFFMRLNQYFFHLSHGRWDQPEPMKYLIKMIDHYPEFNTAIFLNLKKELLSANSIQYWSSSVKGAIGKLDFNLFISAINQPWGWKDPRNSYTLPIWLRLFPNAKIVHVYRNGVDVANSLVTREKRRPGKLQDSLFSCRCSKLDDAFGLWVEYVNTCLSAITDKASSQVYSIRYEDFLIQPAEHLAGLAKFLEISLGKEAISQAITDVQSGRAYAFFGNPELLSFYESLKHHPLMKSLSYDNLQIPQLTETAIK